MTAEQRANLEKLAGYLESGELSAKFDMGRFSEDCDSHVTECGSVGCAVGHGPYAGIPKYAAENWAGYAYRVFGANLSGAFLWCFEGGWYYIDNTPQGAAKRIRYMLKHGIPKDAGEQMLGEAPYLFAEATP